MSTVLVIGGLGVLGSWVTRALVERGERVVTYSRHPDMLLVSDITEKFEHVTGDILDLLKLIQTIKDHKIDRIIHMSAALPGPLETTPFLTYKINTDGTINVLEAARLTDVKRVVFTSSKAAYAVAFGEHAAPTWKPIDEEFPRIPRNVYGATKLFGENMCFNYQRIYGLDVVITRFAGTYGPGKQARHGGLATHSLIIESALLKKPLNIPEGGDGLVDMTYARDAARGVALACFAENLKHRVFHIATGKGETFGHLVKILKGMLGDIPLKIGPGHAPIFGRDSNDMILNIDRARSELGYNPKYDLEAGTKDYIESLRRLGISPNVP